MQELLTKYSRNGQFIFQREMSLKEQSKEVAKLPGVYLVYKHEVGPENLVYIGKSSTIKQDGQGWSEQMLQKRINNKHDGVLRQEYFVRKMQEENISSLVIVWYVTYSKEGIEHIPGFVEGLLIQTYFDMNKRLPTWNKEF